MNKLVLDQPGGFPFETDTLEAMQTAYSLFNKLGKMAGNLAIISGCETTGSTIADGTVYINGEILTFRGGTRSSNVIIREETENREFEDGVSKPVYKSRYATLGSATQQWPWASFQRVENLQQLKARAVNLADTKAENQRLIALEQRVSTNRHSIPTGLISMWSGANVPTGWALCNGSNGTPDLRNKFIMGASADAPIGKTGGEAEVTLTSDQMPEHTHRASAESVLNHRHTIRGGSHSHEFKNYYLTEDREHNWDDGRSGSSYSYEYIERGLGCGDHDYNNNRVYYKKMNTYSASHTHTVSDGGGHTHNVRVENSRGDQAHENRPPFYALAFIMKL